MISPSTRKTIATTLCTRRIGNFLAATSPSNTAGTLATIIPTVVPATTAMTSAYFAARKTVATVHEIAELGTLDPEHIVTPGIFVSQIVKVERVATQAGGFKKVA